MFAGTTASELHLFGCVGHGAYVIRRCAATSTENTGSERHGFLRKKRKIFGRRVRINRAIANSLREAGVGHGGKRNRRLVCELPQDRQEPVRADRAVGADGLNVFVLELFPYFFGAATAEGRPFLRIGHLRDDRQTRKRADRLNRGELLLGVAESFEDKEIHAALFEGASLLLENREDLFRGQLTNLAEYSERPDRSGDQYFMRRGVPRFACEFHAAMIEFHDAVGEADVSELVAIRAECIGLDDLRAGLDIQLMEAKDDFTVGRVQLIAGAMVADAFVQQRAHASVADEDGLFQAVVEIFNAHLLANP